MQRGEGTRKPTIHIYYSSHFSETPSFIQHLLWGMEEEGVPGSIKAMEEDSGVSLGYNAALQSNLEVGIGVGKDEKIVLHYNKLPPTEPLFILDDISSTNLLRSLGTNAARLVKGVPFKSLDPKDNIETPMETPVNTLIGKEDELVYKEDQVENIIKEVLNRLKTKLQA